MWGQVLMEHHGPAWLWLQATLSAPLSYSPLASGSLVHGFLCWNIIPPLSVASSGSYMPPHLANIFPSLPSPRPYPQAHLNQPFLPQAPNASSTPYSQQGLHFGAIHS